MCEADAENADLYLKNAQAYKSELEEVDRRFTEIISAAKRDKIIVADKFPFRYFVDQYGLEYAAAFPGCSDQTDAGAATIAYLIETVQSEKIPYVYYVELSNKNVAESIGEQTGAGLLLLNSCENLTKQEFENGTTYIDLMQTNIENLEKGLNG
jgi:zinc transport system substrate-binding protein